MPKVHPEFMPDPIVGYRWYSNFFGSDAEEALKQTSDKLHVPQENIIIITFHPRASTETCLAAFVSEEYSDKVEAAHEFIDDMYIEDDDE